MEPQKEKVFDAESLSDTATWTSSGWLNISGYGSVLVIIANDDASNICQYKIDARADEYDADSEYALKSASDIAASSQAVETLTDAWDAIKISIRRKTSGQTISSVDVFIVKKSG